MSFTDIKQQHMGGAVQCRFTVIPGSWCAALQPVPVYTRVQKAHSLEKCSLTYAHKHTTKIFTEDVQPQLLIQVLWLVTLEQFQNEVHTRHLCN